MPLKEFARIPVTISRKHLCAGDLQKVLFEVCVEVLSQSSHSTKQVVRQESFFYQFPQIFKNV